MLKMIKNLFNSPEKLLSVMSRGDMQEAKDDKDRILIDEDGNAAVNLESPDVHEDFARHVSALQRVEIIPPLSGQKNRSSPPGDNNLSQ
ncbi:hypothetical protein [Erwinia sp. MMLR14_017]|uniref:hypothetical protein n=1 Tax=Erwinia sp. MMLR14_017 TaxID=3093842 RepID=UPI0039A2C785